MTTLATALAVVGAVMWWRLGPDWREWIGLLAGDTILRRELPCPCP